MPLNELRLTKLFSYRFLKSSPYTLLFSLKPF
ncbi:hypothetical protein T4A_10787 [Trichinella pseudospiralis]|uniref:Uncharacterized protein n=1 Tax=Trichinella pseudospiralis TaxID=6337 RepID=A0A0V1ALJ7_TRIPS|nr:hypothetical protein T4A_10787 [Trichinella pseudospiralis]